MPGTKNIITLVTWCKICKILRVQWLGDEDKFVITHVYFFQDSAVPKIKSGLF